MRKILIGLIIVGVIVINMVLREVLEATPLDWRLTGTIAFICLIPSVLWAWRLIDNLENPAIAHTKVLVCAVGPAETFEELQKTDAAIYSRIYSHVDQRQCATIAELSQMLQANQYDVLHLYALVDEQGAVGAVSGEALLKECAAAGVKTIFMANDNPAEHLITFSKKLPAPLKSRFNLVLTMGRQGDLFAAFLEKLLTKMAQGQTMPMAWVQIAPQNPNRQQGTPECLFLAGQPRLKLMP